MWGKVETRVGVFVLAALCVFAYMGFHIGAFRFDRARYANYTLYFKDISGLSRKADVKISGVKVGWVKDVRLLPDDGMKAEAQVMILKDYALYADAYAMVRQDGLLGPRYIEIVTGDPLLNQLEPGDRLARPSTEPASVDELLIQFKKIADNVYDVTESMKDAIGGDDGKEQLRHLFDNLASSAERLAAVSDVVERTLVRNEDNLDALLSIGTNVQRVTAKLEDDVLPTFQDSIDRIATVFDRDFGSVASRIDVTAQAIEEASVQARDGLRNITAISEKINEGQGLLGKLINEDETYRDLRVAISGFRNYLTKLDRIQIVFDSHFESMQRHAENYRNEDSKGYFDVRIHPNEDYFYMLQLATSEKGFAYREQVDRQYLDDCGVPVNVNQIDGDRFRFLAGDRLTERIDVYKRNSIKIGLQFGKIFGDVAVRFGLFEGSAGVAVDVDIPFNTDKFRWVTSFEAFDMRGWNRRDDRRPHLKWINKMFVMRNIYLAFGADDFASKHNANAFFGAGIRFGDDGVKYFLSSFSGLGCSSFGGN